MSVNLKGFSFRLFLRAYSVGVKKRRKKRVTLVPVEHSSDTGREGEEWRRHNMRRGPAEECAPINEEEIAKLEKTAIFISELPFSNFYVVGL